jgi:hypothetical protein
MKESFSSGELRRKQRGKKRSEFGSPHHRRLLRLEHSPTLVVKEEALAKWLARAEGRRQR